MDITRRLDNPIIVFGKSDSKIKEKEELKKNDFPDNKLDIPEYLIYNYDDEIWAGYRMKMAKMAKENNYNLFMFNNVIYFIVDEHEYYRIGIK
ncbi:hypothetical protein KLL36_11525 [Clostridioides difficile]|uniref:hypothetical protein n=1 Tax=Clostridioides difficile TaxID=1496 RepID=UPI000D1D5CE2|nr:hypothetical protein [Clostridioides difficile]MDL5067660.1 hypothetical protein [Clostridioides difficile]MDN9454069.1 hypothetical protein [Clostridioides difficile]HBF7899111.1 hypothetical protein [Clostridioides difficile]HEK5061742.1 hypothetical protein [Clostridioides difficile]